jgi:membrane protease YdiL (CAAX protease family)
LLNWRIGAGWLLLASLFEPVIFGSITLGYGLMYNGFPLAQNMYVIPEIASYVGTFTLGLFRWGLAEEIGWRGWMLPKLQGRLSPLPASVILAVIVSFWHINPNGISDIMIGQEGEYLYVFCPEIVERLLISIPYTMVITWIFNKTGGSLLSAILFHSASNTSYFWIDGVFGVVKSDFFRISFSVALAIVAIVFTTLLLQQHKKVISIE